MNAANLLLAFVLPCLPLVVAALLFVPQIAGAATRLAPWMPLTALGLLLLNGRVVELPWLLLGARVGLDHLGLWLLALAVIVWTLAGAQAANSLCQQSGDDGKMRDPKVFFCFWLLTWTGNLCVLITLDAASFYAAYALMTFSAYGLIVHYRRPEDVRAGRVYIAIAVAGEGMIVAALLMLGATAGNVSLELAGSWVAQLPNSNIAAFLLFAGFGVKMGVFPLHAWLPLAHPQAPVPASAVLSGVIVKAGLLGWLRFLPLGTESGEAVGVAMLAAGLFTAFYGAAIGLSQNRPKTILAYSTVSQMGLITVVLGMAMLNPDRAGTLVAVAMLFALHHGLSKGALFLAVGLPESSPGWTRRLVWLPALAIAGAPLTSGALAKVMLKAELSPLAAPWMTSALLASSVVTTLLMGRFLYVFESAHRRPASGSSWPFKTLAAGALAIPWAGVWAWHPAWLAKPFEPAYLLDTSLPVLGAGLLALLAAHRWRGIWWPRIPAGDLIALLPAWRVLPKRPCAKRTIKAESVRLGLSRTETGLAQFSVAFLCGIGLVALAFALGWLASTR